MIIFDESTVKVGGIVLPGLFKSLEVKSSALVEEVEVKGKSKKPKQATGYEDTKVSLELSLEDSQNKTALSKLKIIQNLFKKPSQEKPIVYEIVNEHTAARGIKQVIFKDLSTKTQNKKSEITVSIEFWEYVPITITATKKSNKSKRKAKGKSKGGYAVGITDEYKKYRTNRGKAPQIQNKPSKTVAVDDNSRGRHLANKLGSMPY